MEGQVIIIFIATVIPYVVWDDVPLLTHSKTYTVFLMTIKFLVLATMGRRPIVIHPLHGHRPCNFGATLGRRPYIDYVSTRLFICTFKWDDVLKNISKVDYVLTMK